MDYVHEEIQNYILSQGSSKVTDVSVDDYLGSFTKTDLFNFLSLHRLGVKDVIEAYVLENKSKKELIKYIKENIDDVLKSIFYLFKERDLDVLKKILPKMIDKDFDVTNSELSFSLIVYLKRFNIAKFECGADYIKMFMPKEFALAFQKLLKSKRAINENKKYNDMFNFTYSLTIAYGIIDFENYYIFFIKDMFKISKELLMKIVNSFSIADETIFVYEYKDSMIICNAEFSDEETAINFYESQIGEYVEYELDELKALADGDFIKSSSHYNSFLSFLNDKFDLTDEDIEDIFNYFVRDYVYTASIDSDLANNNFNKKADEMFYVSDEEIEQMRMIVERLYLDYPKWIERGKI